MLWPLKSGVSLPALLLVLSGRPGIGPLRLESAPSQGWAPGPAMTPLRREINPIKPDLGLFSQYVGSFNAKNGPVPDFFVSQPNRSNKKVSLGHGAITSYKNDPLSTFHRNCLSRNMTRCRGLEWRLYMWFRPEDHIWTLTLPPDFPKVIRGQWLWPIPQKSKWPNLR